MMRPQRMGVRSTLRHVSRVVSSGSPLLPPAKPSPDGDARPLRGPSPPLTATAAGAAALAEWEAVGMEEGEGEGEGEERESSGFGDDTWIFGPVPSSEEVGAAVLSLQQMSFQSTFSDQTDDYIAEENQNQNQNANNNLGENNTEGQEIASIARPKSNGSSAEISTGSESDWIEPSFHACDQLSSSSSRDRQKVLEAFRLLQASPSVQKMVVSLSSDEAVWNAVMKNKVVRELRKSLDEGISEGKKRNKNGGPFEILGAALNRIFGTTKTKLVEFFRNINYIVNGIFHHSKSEESNCEKMDLFKDVVRSSLMLSVIVFLIIIVTRVSQPNSSI